MTIEKDKKWEKGGKERNNWLETQMLALVSDTSTLMLIMIIMIMTIMIIMLK